ncbi:MAG: glycoside hydrolase, partial [Thermoanaerobaculia bacterium]|nr:glycoside hydrolase [Thermoanaerobaculia bacterium]
HIGAVGLDPQECPSVHFLEVDPSDPNVLYAAELSRLLRSLDRGETWEVVLTAGDFQSLQALPGGVVLAGGNLEDLDAAITRSPDRGETWETVLTPSVSYQAYLIDEFYADPTYGGRVAAKGELLDAQCICSGSVYAISDDGGLTWELGGNVPGVDRWPFWSGAFEAATGDLYVSSWTSPQGLLVSHDHGMTFEAVSATEWGNFVVVPTSTPILMEPGQCSFDGGQTAEDCPFPIDGVGGRPRLLHNPKFLGPIYAFVKPNLHADRPGLFRTEISSHAPTSSIYLTEGRFKVDLSWTAYNGETGKAFEGTHYDDSAVLWFFDNQNMESLVKVIDGCEYDGHYWVFQSAATSVGFQLDVTDTETGAVVQYENSVGEIPIPVVDTRAFSACP